MKSIIKSLRKSHLKSKAFISCISLLWGMSSFIVPAQAFTDVPSDHWAAKAINWVNNVGLMVGPQQGSLGIFDPAGFVNRAQLATIVERVYTLIKEETVTKEEFNELKNEVIVLKAQIKTLQQANKNINNKGLSIDDAIIDSNMSLEEALAGLSENAPAEVLDKQQLIDVYYYSFDGKIHKGQIVVDERLSADVQKVFEVILETKFPVQSIIPIVNFDWDDETSMQANNTSGFNYRYIAGSNTLSNHARGWAIDINPKLNPFIKGFNNEVVQPEGATYDTTLPGTITSEDIIVTTFKDLGWEWGGDWTTNSVGIPVKDYQHFEKILE